jgi:glucokinase
MYAIGIDIGGTKIAGALISLDGNISEMNRVPSPASSAAEMEDAIVDMAKTLLDNRDVSGIGIAAAGFIDADGSTVLYAPNISWRSEPLREKLQARIGSNIVIENDANAAGWAEYRFGAGRGYTHMTMLTSGTGVGGAVIIDGRLVRGGFGAAGELGHVRVVYEGLECGCGAHGCLEQYASGRALLRIASERARALPAGTPLRAALETDGTMDPDALRALLEDGDPNAHEALAELAQWLGRGCASIAAVLDPQIFVIGGGVASAGAALLDPVRASFQREMSARGFHPEPDFAIAELVNDAGVVGAADLARERSRLD